MGHTLSDNRHGLVANAVVTLADGYAEREAAKADGGKAANTLLANAQVSAGIADDEMAAWYAVAAAPFFVSRLRGSRTNLVAVLLRLPKVETA